MKNIGFVFFLAVLNVGFAQEKINWMSLEDAIAAQAKAPKKIMMDVYTTWCPPCKMLDKQTFQNADVAAFVNEHYYAVKFNAEGAEPVVYKEETFNNPKYVEGKSGRNGVHDFAQYLRINSYPTIIFMDEKADMIMPLVGFHRPTQLEIYLKLFAADQHKEVDTKEKWQAHQKAFIPSFKSE